MALTLRSLIVIALLATVASTLRVYPHQLAYFNEAAGGPQQGYKHLLHSNIDWGQDLLLFAEWRGTSDVGIERGFVDFYFPHPAKVLFRLEAHRGTSPRYRIASVTRLLEENDIGNAMILANDPSIIPIGYSMWALSVP